MLSFNVVFCINGIDECAHSVLAVSIKRGHPKLATGPKNPVHFVESGFFVVNPVK